MFMIPASRSDDKDGKRRKEAFGTAERNKITSSCLGSVWWWTMKVARDIKLIPCIEFFIHNGTYVPKVYIFCAELYGDVLTAAVVQQTFRWLRCLSFHTILWWLANEIVHLRQFCEKFLMIIMDYDTFSESWWNVDVFLTICTLDVILFFSTRAIV